LSDLQAYLTREFPVDGEQGAAHREKDPDARHLFREGVLDEETGRLPLVGKIDRIDILAGSSSVAVIDYKTGKMPTMREVQDCRDLQIVLYALAVEAGGVPELDRDTDWQVVQAAYYRVGSGESGFAADKPHLAGDDPEGRRTLERGARLILQTALAARDRTHPYALIPEHWETPIPGLLPCAYCPFQAICRLEEREKPAHLATKLTRELLTIRRE
jgi:RecB family exonuclease